MIFLPEMADPTSLDSGLITLVGFTLQCSKSLYQAVGSFQSDQRTIRELRDELQAARRI
jgi:STAND-like protein